MDELPIGTVTLLFTDMEGSTRLLQEAGERYADVPEGVATFCALHSVSTTDTRLTP